MATIISGLGYCMGGVFMLCVVGIIWDMVIRTFTTGRL